MRSSLFISIEGPDGSGKSTQITNIEDYFQQKGFETVITREPGGTEIGEKIRNIILDKTFFDEMDYMTETLLYAASRAQHVAQVIKPALNAGKVVICDRFVDSSIAYQGFGRKLGNAVMDINSYAVDGCMPDLTFVMNLDPGIGKARIDEVVQDRLEAEKIEFHNEVYRGYLELEKKYPNRVIGIDAAKSIDEIRNQIYFCLDERLKSIEK